MTDKSISEKGSKIVFYCKTCEKIIENPKKIARRYVYICPHCKTKNVAFGTENSIMNFYHIEQEEEGGEELKKSKKEGKKSEKDEKLETE